MAHPAWPLVARRRRRRVPRMWARGLRSRLPGALLARLDVVYLLCLGVLSEIRPAVRVVAARRRIRTAAVQARAIFENTPLVVSSSPVLPADPPALPRMSPRFMLRFAAHACTVLIVSTMIVAVSIGASWTTEEPAVDRLAVAVDQAQPADLLVVPQLLAHTDPGNAEALPAMRGAHVLAEVAFPETHVLAEGETLGELAAQYRVSVASLVWANDLEGATLLMAGQELRIPRVSGVPHVVQEGETIDLIATAFHVAPEAITLFKANGVAAQRPLEPGRELFIPGGVPGQAVDEGAVAALRAEAAGVVREGETNLRGGPGRAYARVGTLGAGQPLALVARHEDWLKVRVSAEQSGWVLAGLLDLPAGMFERLPETNDIPPLPPTWVWPTYGQLTSPFGWRSAPYRSFHDGLDIANRAGTPIVAARAGTVIEAGWCSGFGYCVKLSHGDGIVTIYGHLLKRPPVGVGDVVGAGDRIGSMGSTYDASGGGYSTGVHLHFTVKVNGKAVDPRRFLP